MKKVSLIIIILILITSSACGDTNKTLSLSTGSVGGTYYPIGASIAQLVSSELDDVSINALSGNASVANCRLIGNQEVDMALVQSNVAFWAYEGSGAFEDDPVENIRGIASLYPETLQVVTLASNNIHSIYDLENKKVNIGPEGSGANVDAINLLSVYELTTEDFSPYYMSLADAVLAIKEGMIDAFFITAGFPTVGITELNLQEDIKLLNVDEDKIQAMIELYPYYSPTIIPANTYSSYDYDVKTITTMAMLVASSNLSDDLVYQITEAFWHNTESLSLSHIKGREITIDTSLVGMSIPLHQGAKKYYEEISD